MTRIAFSANTLAGLTVTHIAQGTAILVTDTRHTAMLRIAPEAGFAAFAAPTLCVSSAHSKTYFKHYHSVCHTDDRLGQLTSTKYNAH